MIQAYMSQLIGDIALRIIIAGSIIIVTYFISNYTRLSLERILSKFGASFAKRIAEISRCFILLIGVVVAISVLSLDVTAISIIAIVISLLVLISARDIVLNLASELYIVMRRPFRENDQIKVGDVEGMVRSIRALDTEIVTYDGEVVIVPNSYFLKYPVINKSQSIVRNIELKLIFPGRKFEEIKPVVQEILSELKPELFGEPEILSINEMEDKVEAFISLPIVNVRKLKWLAAKITKSLLSRGIEVEIE
ncbi:MAG: mechanosensitive ion channel [Candidatus Bathyarchaeia archaeon]